PILGNVRDLKPEEIVMRKLLGQPALHSKRLGITALVAKKEGESGAGFDWSDHALRGGLAQQLEPLFLIPIDPCDSHHNSENTGQARHSELLNADRHLRIGIA